MGLLNFAKIDFIDSQQRISTLENNDHVNQGSEYLYIGLRNEMKWNGMEFLLRQH